MLSRRCDKTSEQATMDSGQWTRLKLFRRIIDVIEIDCLFVLLACFDWKPNQSPKKVSTRLDSSRLSAPDAHSAGAHCQCPLECWPLFGLSILHFVSVSPSPPPHKHINTVSCACVPPFGRGGFFWIFSLLLFFFSTFWGASKAICACLVSTLVVVIVAVLRARFVLSSNINKSFMAITHTRRIPT